MAEIGPPDHGRRTSPIISAIADAVGCEIARDLRCSGADRLPFDAKPLPVRKASGGPQIILGGSFRPFRLGAQRHRRRDGRCRDGGNRGGVAARGAQSALCGRIHARTAQTARRTKSMRCRSNIDRVALPGWRRSARCERANVDVCSTNMLAMNAAQELASRMLCADTADRRRIISQSRYFPTLGARAGLAAYPQRKNHPMLSHGVAKVQGGTHPEGCAVRGRERGARPPYFNKIGRLPRGFKNSSPQSGKFLIPLGDLAPIPAIRQARAVP